MAVWLGQTKNAQTINNSFHQFFNKKVRDRNCKREKIKVLKVWFIDSQIRERSEFEVLEFVVGSGWQNRLFVFILVYMYDRKYLINSTPNYIL